MVYEPINFAGPVVVTSRTGSSTDLSSAAQDITLGVLRIAVDYFYAQSRGSMDDPITAFDNTREYLLTPQDFSNTPKVGVRINCIGDIDNGRNKYEAIKVPINHPIYKERATDISGLLELPIVIWKYPLDKSWRDICGKRVNQTATFMHMIGDITIDRWGWAPMYWQNKVGSVLVVRQDRKPLISKQAQILADHCHLHLQPKIEMALEADNSQTARRDVSQLHLNKTAFLQYFEDYKEKMVADGEDPSWADVASPYDT